jgi:hypothetical protein
MSDVIPFPAGRACPQQIGHFVDHFDDDLRAGVLSILREAREAAATLVVARLQTRKTNKSPGALCLGTRAGLGLVAVAMPATGAPIEQSFS